MAAATTAEAVSRRARRFVLAGAGFLVLFAGADLLLAGRRLAVLLGVFGFVLHTVFGKAYSLVPAYFDRDLATPRPMTPHLALTGGGTLLMAAGEAAALPVAAAAGSVAWAAGVAVFLGTLLATIRDNLSGAETGTGEANADRRPIDRAANALVPVALAYLAAGSAGALAHYTPLPGFAYFPRVSHLLAAGTAATMVFAVGFRLLPRFLAVPAPRRLLGIVLPAGAVGPALLAWGIAARGAAFRAGALLEAAAVAGFAAAVALMVARSDRQRVGFYGVLAGAAAGVLGVALGIGFAFGHGLGYAAAHLRLNVAGFLGLTVVGVAYQFYPPAAGSSRIADDRTALASIGLIAGGLALQVAGVAVEGLAFPGRLAVLGGALLYAGLLAALFRERYGGR